MALQTFKEGFLTPLSLSVQPPSKLGEGQAVTINQDNHQGSPKWTIPRSQYATPPIAAHVHTPNASISSRYPQTCPTIRWLVEGNICQISQPTTMRGHSPLQGPMPPWCLRGSSLPANYLPHFTVKLNHLRKRTISWRDSSMGNQWTRALSLSIKEGWYHRLLLRMQVLPKLYAITSVKIRQLPRSMERITAI